MFIVYSILNTNLILRILYLNISQSSHGDCVSRHYVQALPTDQVGGLVLGSSVVETAVEIAEREQLDPGMPWIRHGSDEHRKTLQLWGDSIFCFS